MLLSELCLLQIAMAGPYMATGVNRMAEKSIVAGSQTTDHIGRCLLYITIISAPKSLLIF